MRCPLVREHLLALYQADRNVGLPVKYALIPATLLAAWLLHPEKLTHPRFVAGLLGFALGTAALHLAYRCRACPERTLVLACVMLESYYVVLLALVLRAPVEILAVFTILKVTQLADTLHYHVAVCFTGMSVLFGATAALNPARFIERSFWWETLCLSVMVGASLLLTDYVRRRKCPACSITSMRGELLKEMIRTQEEERKRIARDLHDSRSQNLTGLIIHLDLLQQSLPDDMGAARAQVERIKGIADAALADAHRLIHRLRPAQLDDLGLEAAVRWYVRHAIEPQGIRTDVQADGIGERRFPPQLETAVFRIVQEALANTVQHAHAHAVRVCLQERAGSLTGAVEDDGRGFDVRRALDVGGGSEAFGLLGMRERATLLDGRLRIHSRAGRGTRVEFEFPVACPGCEGGTCAHEVPDDGCER